MAVINILQEAPSSSLYTRLANALSEGSSFRFHHASTPPTKSDPLFAPLPGEKQQRTYCESHLLTVSIDRPGSADDREVFIFAIEILIYTTKNLTTLFVSKADSTGYLNLLHPIRSSAPSPIRVVTSTFVSWLAESRRRPGVRLVVSLFARAQDQYLFPGSVENSGKHVLDDRQLVKWWCKTLDPVLRGTSQHTDHDREAAQAYVIVPGFDKHETSSFFPPSWRSDPIHAPKWQHGHPLRDIAPSPNAPPRCLVPHFPDDPKARYLDELDDEIPDQSSSQTLFSPSKKGRGVWKSIKTLEQFWDSMSFRQECSSGRLVGFVWLVFPPPDPVVAAVDFPFDLHGLTSPLSTGLLDPMVATSPWMTVSRQAKRVTNLKKRVRRRPLTGPIISRQPKIKSGSSDMSTSSQPDESPYYTWPKQGRGQVVLDHTSYLRVHDLLLRLDFSSADAATKSTCKWINEVKDDRGIPVGWGAVVAGLSVGTIPGVNLAATEVYVFVYFSQRTTS